MSVLIRVANNPRVRQFVTDLAIKAAEDVVREMRDRWQAGDPGARRS